MDAKDAIIFQQLDVIRQMTESNLRRISDDFWGVPVLSQPQTDDAAQAGQPVAPPSVNSASAAPSTPG